MAKCNVFSFLFAARSTVPPFISTSTFSPGGCSLRLRAAAAACWRSGQWWALRGRQVDVRVSFLPRRIDKGTSAGWANQEQRTHGCCLQGNEPQLQPKFELRQHSPSIRHASMEMPSEILLVRDSADSSW